MLKPKNPAEAGFEMAVLTGLEPAASGVTGRRYNQLNYSTNAFQRKWAYLDLNQGPSVCKTDALAN